MLVIIPIHLDLVKLLKALSRTISTRVNTFSPLAAKRGEVDSGICGHLDRGNNGIVAGLF